MNEHPIQGLMGTTMERIRQMVDVNTIIGTAITTPDGTVIIPVSKATFGFAAGGSDFPSKQPKDIFGGGSGAGISITPVAFLVVSTTGEVKVIQMNSNENTTDRMIEKIPELLQGIGDLFKKDKEKKEDTNNL